MFEDFVQPVTLEQVEQAMDFLDQNFGRWDRGKLAAVSDYLLPAIHQLFPQQRRFGFAAPFGPKQPARENFVSRLNRWMFGDVPLATTTRRESPSAR